MRHENLTLYTKLICIALLCEYGNVNSNTAICHLCISDFILKQRFFATPSAIYSTFVSKPARAMKAYS